MGVSAVVGIHLYKLQIDTGTILTPAFCAILMAQDGVELRKILGLSVGGEASDLPFMAASLVATELGNVGIEIAKGIEAGDLLLELESPFNYVVNRS